MAGRKAIYSRQCKSCTSPEASTINLTLSRGASIALVDKKLGKASPGIPSLTRHRANHLPEELIAAMRAKSLGVIVGKNTTLEEVTKHEESTILGEIVAKKAQLSLAMEANYNAGNWQMFFAGCRAWTDLIREENRLLGIVETGNRTTNTLIIQSPEFVNLQQIVMRALRDHPAAAKSVARALMEAEKNHPIDVESAQVIESLPALVPRESDFAAPLPRVATHPEATGREDIIGSPTPATPSREFALTEQQERSLLSLPAGSQTFTEEK